MSERYTRLFYSNDAIYYKNSPVIIEARALLNDNELNKVIAQIKLKNIQKKRVIAVFVTVKTADPSKSELESIPFSYLDLSVGIDTSFGQQTAVELGNYSARFLDVELNKVVFEDNSVWESTDIKEYIKCEFLKDKFGKKPLVLQYQKKYGSSAIYVPVSSSDIWRCACGAYNNANMQSCHICNNALSDMLEDADADKLEAQYSVDIYTRAKNLMYSSKSADEFIQAKELFERIPNYEDSKKLAEDCKNQSLLIKNKKKKRIIKIVSAVCAVIAVVLSSNYVSLMIRYNNAVSLMNKGSYDKAESAFDALGEYGDAEEKIMETKYKKAFSLMESGSYDEATNLFNDLKGFSDASDKAKESQYKKASSLMESGSYDEATNIFNDLKGFGDAADKAKESQYKKAIGFLESDSYDAAVKTFEELGDYKDSVDKFKEIKRKRTSEFLGKVDGAKLVSVDDDGTVTVKFGSYNWRVLEITENSALLITEDSIEERKYNTKSTDITWEECALREYLNTEFYNKFSDKEKDIIKETTVVNDDNADYGTSGGNETQDKIFLLSINEAKKYFKNNSDRAISGWWFLRSSGGYQNYAAAVKPDGSVLTYGVSVKGENGIRPALYIGF